MQLQFTGGKRRLREDQGLQTSPVRSAMFRPASTKIKLDHPILTRTEKDREGELRSYPAGPRSRTRGGRTRRSRSGRSRRAAPRRPQAARGSQPPPRGHRRLPQRRPACSCSNKGVRVWEQRRRWQPRGQEKGWPRSWPGPGPSLEVGRLVELVLLLRPPERRAVRSGGVGSAVHRRRRVSLSSPLCSVAIAARPSYYSGRQPATTYGPWA